MTTLEICTLANPFPAVGEHAQVTFEQWVINQKRIVEEIGYSHYLEAFLAGLTLACSDIGFTREWAATWQKQQAAKFQEMGPDAYFLDLIKYFDLAIGPHSEE